MQESVDLHNREAKATALLKSIQEADRGRLKIFLGYAPGVGKTYTMLNAAREHQQQDGAVLVGLVETHGRKETERLLDGFEVMPRQQIHYQNQVLTEFDLDASLQRKPKLLLVDELAHTNVPGSRHKRRYQDIAELLDAGIDVYTTLNIQHLASLSDLVLQITGIRVRETVPDEFIDKAHEIVFVDLPPDTLIRRLQQGKVYLPEYARSALDAFFSPANLTALRELAMREVMERVENCLKGQLDAQAKGLNFVIQEKLLVLVSTNSNHDYLIRNGRQIADRRKIPWLVVWVDTGRVPSPQSTNRLQSAFTLAKELGAQTEVLRGPGTFQTIVPFITEHRISNVLVGAGSRRRFKIWEKRLYRQLIESALPLEVSVIRPARTAETSKVFFTKKPSLPVDRWGYGVAALSVAAATVIALILEHWILNTNLVLVYVLAVIMTGLRYGSSRAIAASVMSFLSFNFFLTEPRYTFVVERQTELATLLFLLLIALICGPAASRIRRQFILLREANRYSEAMRTLGQSLSVAENTQAVWRATAKKLSSTLQVESCIAVMDADGSYVMSPDPSTPLNSVDMAALEWTQRHAIPSGHLTDTLSASSWTIFPICKEGLCIASALTRFKKPDSGITPYDNALIQGMLQQAADTWRRIRLAGDLESARVKTEVEQLRSALLSSISHDLKSPLAAMMGAAESLRLLKDQLEPQDRAELVDTILQESRRLESYIQNLLDMTRLGYGTLKIERDWVSIADIVGSALVRLKRYYPGIRTETRFGDQTPVLYVHAALIEQAIFNILENAAKFTPPEEAVVISVFTRDDKCLITIDDKGPGIPPGLREKIFDMFYVVANGDKKSAGTGMGLAICRGMISAHRGSVYATDRPDNKGSRIVVELPIKPQAIAENAAADTKGLPA